MEEAEASAALTLEIIDGHPAVLHLPLTFTLAEASRRLLRSRPGLVARGGFPAPHVDTLRVARATLAFARSPQGRADESGTGGGPEVGRAVVGGGWCSFGDEILAAVGGGSDDDNDGGEASPTVRDGGSYYGYLHWQSRREREASFCTRLKCAQQDPYFGVLSNIDYNSGNSPLRPFYGRKRASFTLYLIKG